MREDQTELIWGGKYDKIVLGKKVPVDKIELPFQAVETINESREKQKGLDSFSDKKDNWKNKLIWGDNKYVLASLLKDFKGEIDLIYIDPPFFTGSNMPIQVTIGEEKETLTKEPSIIEEVAYRNIWKHDMGSFSKWIYERLTLMWDLLSERGIIFVRFDWHYSHYVKIILDEVFGKNNFRNEIMVNRTKKNVMQSHQQKVFPTATDSLFFYSKGEGYTLYETTKKLDTAKKGFWRHMDDSAGKGSPKIFFGKKLSPPGGKHFKYSQDKINEMIGDSKLRLKCKECGYEHTRGEWTKCPKCNRDNPKPEYWVKPRKFIMLDTNWTDIPGYSFTTGYPTENSEELLERVILSASKEGDLVADFFGGSGTTAVVAEKLNRRWVTCDIGKFSVHTIRKRLLDLSVKKDKIVCKPFEILNLGRYERQRWQKENLGESLTDYIKFIAELYHSEYIVNYKFIHAKKGNRVVHIGAIDSPITLLEIRDVLEECKKNNLKKIDILGWEFENGLNDIVQTEASKEGVDLQLRYIPKEVMNKKAVESKEIEFYELASLDVKIKKSEKEIEVELKDFIIPNPDMIHHDLQDKIKDKLDYIDYWSIDWNFKGDTFHNQWQDFRTKNQRTLKAIAKYKYDKKGKYQILVKVVDIFGNDTTKLFEVEI